MACFAPIFAWKWLRGCHFDSQQPLCLHGHKSSEDKPDHKKNASCEHNSWKILIRYSPFGKIYLSIYLSVPIYPLSYIIVTQFCRYSRQLLFSNGWKSEVKPLPSVKAKHGRSNWSVGDATFFQETLREFRIVEHLVDWRDRNTLYKHNKEAEKQLLPLVFPDWDNSEEKRGASESDHFI